MVNQEIPKKYYAGGFLYNPDTKQVLLHKRDDKTIHNPNMWSFFGGGNEAEDNGSPVDTFIREVKEELGIVLSSERVVYPCDYFSEVSKIHRFSFYALDNTSEDKVVLNEGAGFKWMDLEEALKTNIGEKTRQDLLIFRISVK